MLLVLQAIIKNPINRNSLRGSFAEMSILVVQEQRGLFVPCFYTGLKERQPTDRLCEEDI